MTTPKEQADLLREIAMAIQEGRFRVRQFNLITGAIEKWDIHDMPNAVQVILLGESHEY